MTRTADRRGSAGVPRLIVITDPSFDDAALTHTVAALARGLEGEAWALQLRDKRRPRDVVARLARELRAITRAHGALFLVNGDVALAGEVSADGVHLGSGAGTPDAVRRALGEGARVTCAVHDDAELLRALEGRADGVLVSPISSTPGKGAPIGVEGLRRVRARIDAYDAHRRPALYALGGVDVDNARSCAEAGADGVAVIRAVLAAASPTDAARRLGSPFAPMG